MPIGPLKRTYLLRGLDRVLYSTQPQWHEGTFFQNKDEEGHLVLHVNEASPMTIRTLYIDPGGGFDSVTLETTPAVYPGPGEITVGLRASSLNYHDLGVGSGATGPTARRIPMSEGAGEVTAVGEGVREFAVGDHVVSTFFPHWLDGEPQAEGLPARRATASTAMHASR